MFYQGVLYSLIGQKENNLGGMYGLYLAIGLLSGCWVVNHMNHGNWLQYATTLLVDFICLYGFMLHFVNGAPSSICE